MSNIIYCRWHCLAHCWWGLIWNSLIGAFCSFYIIFFYHEKAKLVTYSCPTLCDCMDCSPPWFPVHEILQARILESGSYSLLQGIFLTHGSNPGLLHCRQILYHLNHQGSPFLLHILLMHKVCQAVWPKKQSCLHHRLAPFNPWLSLVNFHVTHRSNPKHRICLI